MMKMAFEADRTLVVILNAMMVAYNVCNCSPIKSDSSHYLDDVSSLPRHAIITRNHHHAHHADHQNHQHSNATITKVLSNFSILKRRLTRQTPTTKVDERLLCETDHDCQESSSRNAYFASAENAHNDTYNTIQLICINGACGPKDNPDQNELNKNNSLLTPNSAIDAAAERLRMLPIMIVLGVMFVGICVAMNLFSRARFKNHRSGIFANPRILKVANAQNSQNGAKRRRSKVSSRRSRTELLARAQQMSEQLQKQHQLQSQIDQTLDEVDEEQEINESELCGTNQLTTYVQVESIVTSDTINNERPATPSGVEKDTV